MRRRMGLLSQKIQNQIRDLRAAGNHGAAIQEIIRNFDQTPLISSDFSVLDAIFMDATTDLNNIADSPDSTWLSGMLLEKYAVLALYSGRCEVWKNALSTIDQVSDAIPELKEHVMPLSLRFLLRLEGVDAALNALPDLTDMDLSTPTGMAYMHSLLDTLTHALRLKDIDQLPDPAKDWVLKAKPETRLWYSTLYYLGLFLGGDTDAIGHLHELTTQNFGGEDPVAENSIIQAVYAGWQVLNGDVEDAMDSVDAAFGTITEPFWDDQVRYFPEVLYPVFWSGLTMTQSEEILIQIIKTLGTDDDLVFPALIAGLILLGIYGARQDHFSWYTILRMLDAMVENIPEIDTKFLDMGISNLETIVGTPELMVYDAKYENKL